MFGWLLRAAPQILFLAFLAALLGYILEPLLGFITDGGAHTSSPLVEAIGAVQSNLIIVGIVGLILAGIARAVVEARMGAR